MKKPLTIPVVLLKTRTGYNAFSPVVEGCFVTDKTIDSTLKRMKSALEFHLEGEALIKWLRRTSAKKVLRNLFDEYGTDAVYVSMKIAA